MTRVHELRWMWDDAVYRLIAARRAASGETQPSDLLDLLLAARTEDGQPMSDRQLRDEIITLIIAGHETVAGALSGLGIKKSRRRNSAARSESEAARLWCWPLPRIQVQVTRYAGWRKVCLSLLDRFSDGSFVLRNHHSQSLSDFAVSVVTDSV